MALSAGAVQHPASGELYAVLADGARLCSWKRSHKRMLDGASASFSAKERVGSVLVSAAVPGAVLVHADADCSSTFEFVAEGGVDIGDSHAQQQAELNAGHMSQRIDALEQLFGGARDDIARLL